MTADLIPRAMSLAEFEPLVGETFLADCGEADVPLVLVEATAVRFGSAMFTNAFTLVFRSQPDALLVDGRYALHNRRFGPDLIALGSLIKPKHGPPGYYYQANFN